MRRASNAVEAAEMMGHDDGGKALAATLETYTAAANGKRADDFGKTVFPAKNFSATEPLREFKGFAGVELLDRVLCRLSPVLACMLWWAVAIASFSRGRTRYANVYAG